MHITIDRARPADLPALLALLEQLDLPQAGLAAHLPTTVVARTDEQICGCAALELYGQDALLRSVAVAPQAQGRGLGQQLTQAALERAKQHGVTDVYLLTETAETFFPRFGFQPVARGDVAPVVQGSVEFTSACPIEAQAMRLHLIDDK